jgi:hypothetical protein
MDVGNDGEYQRNQPLKDRDDHPRRYALIGKC